jgi:hypothetical protein
MMASPNSGTDGNGGGAREGSGGGHQHHHKFLPHGKSKEKVKKSRKFLKIY